MQKAKERVQELLTEDSSELQKGEHMEFLKPRINGMLHEFLPDDTTIKEAEILAMVIHEMICNPDEFLKTKDKQ